MRHQATTTHKQSNAQAGRWPLRSQRGGTAFIEYYVLASIVMVVTFAFFQNALSEDSSGLRMQIEEAFSVMCEEIAEQPCE